MNKKSIFQILNYLLFLFKFTYFYLYFKDSEDLSLFLFLELLLLISYVISYNFYFENVFVAVTKFNQNYDEIINLKNNFKSIYGFLLYTITLILYLALLNFEIKRIVFKETLFLLFINFIFVRFLFIELQKSKVDGLSIFNFINLISFVILITNNSINFLLNFYLVSILIIGIYKQLKVQSQKIIFSKINIFKNDLRNLFLLKKIVISLIFSNSHYFFLFICYFILPIDIKDLTLIILIQITFLDLPRALLKSKNFLFFFKLKHLANDFNAFKIYCKKFLFKNFLYLLLYIILINIFFILIDLNSFKFFNNYNYLIYNICILIVYFKGFLISIIYNRRLGALKTIKLLLLQNIIIVPLFVSVIYYFNFQILIVSYLIIIYLFLDLLPYIKILIGQRVFRN